MMTHAETVAEMVDKLRELREALLRGEGGTADHVPLMNRVMDELENHAMDELERSERREPGREVIEAIAANVDRFRDLAERADPVATSLRWLKRAAEARELRYRIPDDAEHERKLLAALQRRIDGELLTELSAWEDTEAHERKRDEELGLDQADAGDVDEEPPTS